MIPTKINLDLDFEKEEFINFLEKEDLRFDSCDEAYAIRENGKIVATGAYEGNILKLFAVSDEKRDMGLIPLMVSFLKEKLFEKKINETFIFTKPKYEAIFKSMLYETLAKTEKIVLLTDNIEDYKKWIKSIKELGDFNAAIVMNANPFTLGHRHLADVAAAEITNIIVFVVEENKSIFSFKDRLKMVQKGLEDIWLEVQPGGKYIISKNTFPSYFLKTTDDISKEFAKLDADLFIGRIAKDLGLKVRYVGEEPNDELTSVYNKALIERAKLDDFKIRVVPRYSVDGVPVSASYVRSHLYDKALLEKLLPKTTIDILNERRN